MVTNTRRLLITVSLPALFFGCLLVGTSFLGIQSINRLQANRAVLLSRYVGSLSAAREMEVRLRQLRFHSLLHLMNPTAARFEVVENDYAQFERAFQTAHDLADSRDEKLLLDTIWDGYRSYRHKLDQAFRGAVAPSSLDGILTWADAHPVRHLLEPCEELLRVNRQAMEDLAQQSREVGAQGRTMFLLLGILCPVGCLVSGFGVAWGLSRSITRLRIRLRDAGAQLDQELGTVRVTGEGSATQIDKQLEHVLERVNRVIFRLQQQQRDMLRAEQLAAVGQLATSIAHEVRNPLTGIKLLVGAALRRQPAQPLSAEDLQVIFGEVQRLERKVQALLDFARPVEPNRQPCDLRGPIRQAMDLVAPRLDALGVRRELHLPDGPVQVSVDGDQMTSVLVNLFLNALDAMPQGGELSVSLQRDAEGGVRLHVADSGKGIDPAVAQRLFTPFTSTKKTGTGLGLSICRRVVADHGGTLTAANRPEGGACFTITLPTLAGASG